MKRTAKLLPAQVTGLTSKGLARLHIDSHPRQGLELWGPLPGEEVMVQLGQRRNCWLQQIQTTHPQRREPRCAHFGACGGCSLQHWDESAQLQWKSQRIYNQLPPAQRLPPVPSPQPFHYRTKVELSFLGQQLGFHRRGCFDRSVAVEHCWIAPPSHREAVRRTRAWQARHRLQGWSPRNFVGDLRYLMIRQANPGREWLAVLVTRAGLSPELVQEWAEGLQELQPSGLIWVEQESPAAAIVPLREHLMWGDNRIRQPLGPLHFELGWRSFFQSNPPAYRLLLEQIREWMEASPPVRLLDLYCGIGSIGLYVAPPQSHLLGLETVAEAVEDARRCAQAMGRTARFEVGQAEDWQDWDVDVALVDPPRSGCHPRFLQVLKERGPKEIFYISCNPERFLKEWSELSQVYRLQSVRAFDFFPQTAHCELLCWLRRL